tara:strand:+ start:5794 stop:7074 length:1281 start_codon:yes stop_codon:yes gene_type:complete
MDQQKAEQEKILLDKLLSLPKEELAKNFVSTIKTLDQLQTKVKKLEEVIGLKSQEELSLGDDHYLLSRELFGKSSEKIRQDKPDRKKTKSKKRKPSVQKPSSRWPDLEMVAENISFKNAPKCKCCDHDMEKIKGFEVSETVECVPRRFYIKRQLRQKYKCNHCKSNIFTTPVIPRIVPGGIYSDDFIIDVATSKYADHLPVERIKKQLHREGLEGIDHKTLIEQTHHLADSMRSVYRDLKKEVQASKVIHADETPWKMMENSEKKSWYLWGYFNQRSAFYKGHDSRSKDAANDVIKGSSAKYLVVDGYTAYNQPSKARQIEIANCWAYTRRKFYKIKDVSPDADTMITLIGDLYKVEDDLENKNFDQRLEIRKTKSKDVIDKIRDHLHSIRTTPKSELGKAQAYMMKYWLGLIKVLDDPDIRNPVF